MNTPQPKISTLLVFNTHLDPTNQDGVQLVQLRDLGAFIHDVVIEERQKSPETNFGAVLVGDFNFTSSCRQYKEMWEIMKKEGVELTEMLSNASQKEETYSPKNPLVQWPTSAGRIDQIFGVASITSKFDKTFRQHHQLKKVSLTNEKVRSDVVVSDHYPFEVTLQISDE